MTADRRAASPDRRRALAVGLVHAGFFVVAAWVALATSAEFISGPYEAAPFFPVLAVILVGAIRASGGAAGGRAILVAGDLGLGGLLVAQVVFTDEPFRATSNAWYAGAIMLGIGAALSAAIVLPAAGRGRIDRLSRDRGLLVLLVVVDLAGTLWSYLASSSAVQVDPLRYLGQLAADTVPYDLALFAAWWWGARWPLGLTGVAGLVVSAAYADTFLNDLGRSLAVMLPPLLATAAGLVGPAFVPSAATPVGGVPSGRSRPADVWLALGGLAWPLLVLIASFPLVSDACFECGPRFPGDGLLWAAGVLTVVVVPATAALSVGFGGASASALRIPFLILATGTTIVLLEIVAGIAGVYRFGFMPYAAPAVVLVGLGALVGLRRPKWLARAGIVAGLGGAVLVAAWTWGVHARYGSASLGELAFALASLGEAAVAAVLVARESSRVRAATPDVEPNIEPA